MIPALQIICTEGSISIETTENTGINKSRNREESCLPERLRKVWDLVRENKSISKPAHL